MRLLSICDEWGLLSSCDARGYSLVVMSGAYSLVVMSGGYSLVVMSGGYSLVAMRGGYSLAVVHGLLIVVSSLVAEQEPGMHRAQWRQHVFVAHRLWSTSTAAVVHRPTFSDACGIFS